MANFTSNTYTLKRKILTFSNKISKQLSKPDRKFTADITYGMLASQSCLLTDVVDQLHEDSKKINIVDRLSRHLDKGTPAKAAVSYLQMLKKWVLSEPVIYIDDSDVVKPDGYKFESLGIVRDGSESTSTKNVYKKGYHVTEACVLTGNNHPVSIFSRIHSSAEKDYKSANTITFDAIEQGTALFGKATFAMDRGYDDNKMFLKLDKLGQEYVIRLTSKRKLLYHNKWTPATELRDRRKGKIKTSVFYKGKDHEAYLSHVKVQITASRKNIYLVLVYGITEHPMMLATNKEIKSKEDVIQVARIYFSRWKIEESTGRNFLCSTIGGRRTVCFCRRFCKKGRSAGAGKDRCDGRRWRSDRLSVLSFGCRYLCRYEAALSGFHPSKLREKELQREIAVSVLHEDRELGDPGRYFEESVSAQ